MSMYICISNRTRLWEIVWGHTIPYKTVRDRARPYIQPQMKSTPRVSSTVSISYKNRMELNTNKGGWVRMLTCKCPVNRVKVVFDCTRLYQNTLDRTWNRTKIVWKSFCKSCSNSDKPCLIKYIHAVFVHSRATFESKSYQLIPRHGWSSILVPVNPCITEFTVLEPCAQPCSVSNRLKLSIDAIRIL